MGRSTVADMHVKGKKEFVRVTWWDAEDYSEAGWLTEEDAHKFNNTACVVISYGWLVSKTKDYLTVAADHIAPKTYGRAMKIPRKMVKSVETIPLDNPAQPVV